jgi:hypothetical protein
LTWLMQVNWIAQAVSNPKSSPSSRHIIGALMRYKCEWFQYQSLWVLISLLAARGVHRPVDVSPPHLTHFLKITIT